MSLLHERGTALYDAVMHLPRHLPQLVWRLARPNPALIAWCKEKLDNHEIPVVLCRIERLGDIVATTPVAGYLRRSLGPRARIAWVCATEYVGLLEGNLDIDAVFSEPCLTTWMMLCRSLPRGTMAIEMFLDSDRCCWTGLRVKQRKSGWSRRNYFCHGNSLLAAYSSAAGYPVPDVSPQLPRFAELRRSRSHPTSTARPRVAVHFSSRDPARSLPPDSARSFSEAALAAGCQLVELGHERVVAEQLTPVTSLPPSSDISAHLELLASADCFVGVDSGFAHCANALQIPAVILLSNFRTFPGYFPFSGPHARGPFWRCLRSDGALADIAPNDIAATLLLLLEAVLPAR